METSYYVQDVSFSLSSRRVVSSPNSKIVLLEAVEYRMSVNN